MRALHAHQGTLVRSTLLAALVALTFAGRAVGAGEAPTLGLTPVGDHGTYFEISLAPGDATTLEVEAANFGEAEVVARTYRAEVYSIVNGGFGATLFGEPVGGTAAWVTLPEHDLTLGPGEAVILDVHVAVPPGTPPGEYVAALVIENAEPVRGEGAMAIDQVNRSAIAVAIDVPGDRTPLLGIGEASHGVVTDQSVVSVEVKNPGNVHVRPAGEVVVRGPDGDPITARPVAMDAVYAGTSTTLEVPVGMLLGAGEHCIELRLADPEVGASDGVDCIPLVVDAADVAPPDGAGSPDTALGVLAGAIGPAGLGAGAVALVAGLILLVLLRRRRRRATT